MTKRRLATTGVALVALLGLGLTGCGDRTGADAPAERAAATGSASPATTPRDELTAAIEKLNEQTLRVKLDSAMLSAHGVTDPRARTMQTTLTMAAFGEVRMLVIGADTWVKFDGELGEQLGGSRKWLRMDTGNGVMPVDDPGGAKKLLAAVVDVRRSGDRSYAGTLDYTRSGANGKALMAAGDKAKALPFTATVDEQGRLSTFTMNMTPIDASLGQMSVTYSEFGTPVRLSPPAPSAAEEAPAEIAAAFSGTRS
ncbi:hypothetical protein DRA43_05110 [Micromonospora provocatoris]|nr:hypothetical protein [Micromonospora provocatoris]RBJ09205.1 hypothetical protein DRA43_05110 [Micromonospora provocatoris]